MIDLKTDMEIKVMAEGGKILNEVMSKIFDSLDEGVSTIELDRLAENEIKKRGAFPSFKMVKGYKWSICACVNDVVVHGIPDFYKVKKDDLVGLDMGVYYKGFHTDSSWSVRVGNNKGKEGQKIDNFLSVGRQALDRAIEKARVGNYIFDISEAIEKTITSAGFSVVKSLIGHGVGKNLHEAPEVPGIVTKPREKTILIENGLTIAIEVIYNFGAPEVVYKRDDGWTIQTKDGKISGLFETTVAVTDHGVILLSKKYGPSGNN